MTYLPDSHSTTQSSSPPSPRPCRSTSASEERVFLLPRREGEFGRVGVVAEVIERGQLPSGRPVATVVGLHRGLAGRRAGRRPARSCASRCRRSTTATPTTSAPTSWRASTAPWSRRSSSCAATTGASPPSCARSRSPARWPTPPGYSPDLSRRAEAAPARDPRRQRAPRARGRAAARAPGRAAGAPQDPRRRRVRAPSKQQREYFLRKQMESIRKELGEDEGDLIAEYERKIAEAEMPEAVAEQAEQRAAPARAPGRAVAGVIDDPQLPRLADRGAVVEALRGAARPRAHPRGARRRPRRPRGREAADHRVHRGAQAAPGARRQRGEPRQRRDPDPGRPARHRQDLDRRVDRPRARARVRPHLAWAASTTRPRSAATAAPTSAPCRAGSSAPCATPGR